MLSFLLLSCLLSSVASYEWVRWSSGDEIFRTPEFDLLSKVLTPSIVDPRSGNVFYEDFWSDVARHNFSESDYADNCLKVYLAAKPTPLEMELLMHDWDFKKFISGKLKEAKSEEDERMLDLFGKFIVHFNTSRREALKQLSKKALPESSKFANEHFAKLLEWFMRSISESWGSSENGINNIEQVVESFKLLNSEIKLDLERSFCFRNVLTWINSDMNGIFNKTFESASDLIGLNVSHLLKGNPYLSYKPINEVKKKFRRMAEEINMPAQEYVDLCAKTFSVMKIIDGEHGRFNNRTFMGEEWGTRVHNSSEEFIDLLLAENAPFVKSLARRWKYVRSQPVFATTRNILRHIEVDLLNTLLALNNRMATGRNSTLKVFPKAGNVFSYYKYRQFEKAYCFQYTLESIDSSPECETFVDFREYLFEMEI